MGGGSSKGAGKKPVGQGGLHAPSSLATAATSRPRDWNDEFQRALDLLDAEDFVQGYAQLAAVCSDFQRLQPLTFHPPPLPPLPRR